MNFLYGLQTDKNRLEMFPRMGSPSTDFQFCRNEFFVVGEPAEVNFVKVGRVAAGHVSDQAAATVEHLTADITLVALVLRLRGEHLHVNGRAHFKKCKQFFEYQHLLLLRDIWWSKF